MSFRLCLYALYTWNTAIVRGAHEVSVVIALPLSLPNFATEHTSLYNTVFGYTSRKLQWQKDVPRAGGILHERSVVGSGTGYVALATDVMLRAAQHYTKASEFGNFKSG